MRLPDFCNCDHDTSTCSNVRLSRRHALSHVPRVPEPKPPRATRVVAHLTMRGPASAKTATPLRRQTRVRAPFAPGGISRSTDPSNGAPPQRCFRPCAGRATQPLTLPVATNESRDYIRCQDRLHNRSVKSRCSLGPKRLPSTSARSARLRDASDTNPPPCPGLSRLGPASDALSPFACEKEGLDFAASASSSPAGARCHAPLVDFCNRNDPQARTCESPKPES